MFNFKNKPWSHCNFEKFPHVLIMSIFVELYKPSENYEPWKYLKARAEQDLEWSASGASRNQTIWQTVSSFLI